MNVLTGVPSAQGYAALVNGKYYQATGAHLQEDLNPATLSGTVWDELNVTVLLSLPSYFVTPVPTTPPQNLATPFPTYPSVFGDPTVNDPVPLAAGGRHTWYFGGTLTVGSGQIPVQGAPANALARIGLVTPSGSVDWQAGRLRGSTGSGGTTGSGASFHFRLRAPTRAAGIVIQNGPGPTVTALAPEVSTAEDGTVALDGRMQSTVSPPHWTYSGAIGAFAVFRNSHPRGWAWTAARDPGGRPGRCPTAEHRDRRHPAVPGPGVGPGVVGPERGAPPGLARHDQPVVVGATGTGQSPRGSPMTAPVASATVTQRVEVPAGDFVVTFRYAPATALAGLALSAVGGVALVVFGVFVLVGWRRRRQAREGLRAR